jgi:protein-S-isoprenylcysteine O-methyltransferase Ste14
MKSKILVFIQFSTIFLMFAPFGGGVQHLYLGLSLIIPGLLVGLFAIANHPVGNFNIRPDIKENCTLISHGIYKYIRHPMYASVLSSMLGVALMYANIYTSILYLILLANMLTKMFYEESLWGQKECGYDEYSSTTYRLIPFVF